MRWKPTGKYKYGDYRVGRVFLFLPRADFNGETRWLEWAKAAQKCIGHWAWIFPMWSLPYSWADDLPVGDISFAQYLALL